MKLRRSIQKSVCMYFYIHEPYELSKVTFFEIGSKKSYFTKQLVNDYIATNHALLQVLNENKNFTFAISISGVLLDQLLEHEPKVVESFKDLIKTDRVELIAENYYHSLAWLFSKEEFAEQIRLHMKSLNDVFHKKPKIFRNTELIYNNELAQFIRLMGFEGILAEGFDSALHGKSPNHIYTAVKSGLHPEDKKITNKYSVWKKPAANLKVLLKNYSLSKKFEDIKDAYDFVEEIDNEKGETLNIFVDYSKLRGDLPLGDQYSYWKHFADRVTEFKIKFRTPSETIEYYDEKYEIDQHDMSSWKDLGKDLSSWTSNEIQNGALRSLYELENIIKRRVKRTKDKKEAEILLRDWRKLQTSNYFEKMNPAKNGYDAAYDSYINYMNILNDLMAKI